MIPLLARWIGLVLGCIACLAGCARPFPQTLPLAAGQQAEAERLWYAVATVNIPARFEADFRLGWEILGSKGTIDAFLVVQHPSLLRFSAQDPLGRPLYIAVADGLSFTLADNRKGVVYQGQTGSKFWQTYIPVFLTTDQLPGLLSGLPPNLPDRMPEISQETDQSGFWYVWQDDGHIRHHVLLDKAQGTMSRHLLFNEEEELLLDLSYQEYFQLQGQPSWPRLLTITGDAVTGTVTLHLAQVVFHADRLPDATFRLTAPPHFTWEQVD